MYYLNEIKFLLKKIYLELTEDILQGKELPTAEEKAEKFITQLEKNKNF